MSSEISVSNMTTLSDFIRREEIKSKGTGIFSEVLLTIALGTKIVSRGVNRAGLASLLGLTGELNVQGEVVQRLDVYADSVFAKILGNSGEFVSLVSEERESVIPASGQTRSSKYVIAFDPLDGSSNIDVNVAIGSIWGIYRSQGYGINDEDFKQTGYQQIAAGYTVYGSSTMFVFTTGSGVQGFTLDPTIGEYILTHPDMKIPTKGNIYSCNEANCRNWSKGEQAFIEFAKDEGYSARYVGSLCADFHRTLLKGGIFLYPGDVKRPSGKLRHLYEAAPLAMIAEQAGGKASDGRNPILSILPEGIHQRTPLFIGSSECVDKLLELKNKLD